MHAGLAGSGAEEQLFVPPQSENNLVPGGLLDFFDPQAQNGLPQLFHHAGETYGVKWHRFPPPSSRRTAG